MAVVSVQASRLWNLPSAGLEIDPSNAQLKDGLQSVTRAQSNGGGGGGLGGLFGPEFMARLAMNPQVCSPTAGLVCCRCLTVR